MSKILKTVYDRHMIKTMKLSDELLHLLSKVQKDNKEGITLGEFFNVLGDKGFGLFLILLSLPSALPLPAPGYSTPFGLILLLVALQMIVGKTRPWMPEKARSLSISDRLASTMFKGAASFFSKTEVLIKPRLKWMKGRVGHLFAGFIVLFMACLMTLPIPLTNTAPAGVVFLIGVSLMEEDGFLLLLASVLGMLAAGFYALAFSLMAYYGAEGLGEAFELIKQLI